MKRIAVVAMMLGLCTLPTSAQVSINFDGTGAPCLFAQTAPLTTFYSGQGVTFTGNGSVLNRCGGWRTGDAHSGTDFIGLNWLVAPLTESMHFAVPQSFFDIFVGSNSNVVFDYFLDRTAVGSLAFSTLDPRAWTEITYTGAFDRVDVTSVMGELQLDDLTTRTSVTPEPASLALVGTGLFGMGIVVRRRRITARDRL